MKQIDRLRYTIFQETSSLLCAVLVVGSKTLRALVLIVVISVVPFPFRSDAQHCLASKCGARKEKANCNPIGV